MEVKASSKNIGVSAIKAKIPADIVRSMNALEAIAVLTYMRKGTALHIKKVIQSAVANAKNNYNLDPESLYISEVRVDKGPIANLNARRFKPSAKGGYKPFSRKYCHVSVVLTDKIAVKANTAKQNLEVVTPEVVKTEVKKKPVTKAVKARKTKKSE
jgi:large subunit ribosomal protein L22